MNQAAELLGISKKRVRRLDADVFARTPRAGVRSFSAEEIEALRRRLEADRSKRTRQRP